MSTEIPKAEYKALYAKWRNAVEIEKKAEFALMAAARDYADKRKKTTDSHDLICIYHPAKST